MFYYKKTVEKESNLDDDNEELWKNLNIQEEDDENDYLEIELNKQLNDENFSASSKFVIAVLPLKLCLF